MSRFVKGETCVLTLANGDKLIVKKRLNRGETAEMFARMRVSTEQGLVVDRTKIGIAHVLAYLLDWELQQENIPLRDMSWDDRERTLNNLDPDDFAEIDEAITVHVDRVQTERDAAKKVLSGGTGSPATSPSASSSAGTPIGSTS